MTDRTSASDRETVAPCDTDGDLQWAVRVASRVKDRWQKGDPPDLVGVLASHPALKNHRTIVFELAYEELCIRRKAGESLDASEFSQRFQSLSRSLDCYIAFRSIVGSYPGYDEFQNGAAWPEPGSQFLGFDLICEIGRGARGRVFLALERALGERVVVVKVAPRNGHEAELLGRLRHANIVDVHSIQEDTATGLTAICMTYLGQATLAAVLDEMYADRRPPLRAHAILAAVRAANQRADPPESPPPDRILRGGSYVEGAIHLGAKLAEALAHAHGNGIFHRDLKPSNILMSPDGRPVLLDFNLSVHERDPIWVVGGTVLYMAPEELSALCDMPSGGRSPRYDPRSDLFSLGVILYELLTGFRPFETIPGNRPLEEIAADLRQRHKAGPRPIRERNRRVDKGVARLIQRCLAYDPDHRPENADELAAALRKELSFSRRTRRWLVAHRRLVFLAASTVSAILLGAMVYFILRPPYAVRQFQQGLTYYQAGEDDRALECLNTSLRSDSRWNDALLARARVYQHRGDFQLAFADFDAASRLTPSPTIDACKGYCLSRLAQHKQATALYSRSLAAGDDSPAVLNNLGYSWLRLGRLQDAETCLHQAIQGDDRLQAPHHNLVLVFLQRAYAGQAVPAEAFIHAHRALEIGPVSGKLYRDLATLYALAGKQDAALAQAAVGYVAKAVDLGINAETFQSDPAFSGLKQDPAFQKALGARGVSQRPSEAVAVIDPSGEPHSPQR